MGKKSTPPPPDYNSLAIQQGALNKEAIDAQTLANRANQITPTGSLTWTKDPKTGQWTSVEKYDPKVQGAIDQQMAIQTGLAQTAGNMLGRVEDSVSQPISYEGMTNIPVGSYKPPPGTTGLPSWAQVSQGGLPQGGQLPGAETLQAYGKLGTPQTSWGKAPSLNNLSDFGSLDFSQLGAMPEAGFGAVQEVQDAMMNRLNPGLQEARAAESQRLKAQGITEGSDQWNNAMAGLGRNENDARQQALLAATGEYGNIFNRGMQVRQQGVGEQQMAAEFANALRGQQFGEGMTLAEFQDAQRGRQFGENMSRAEYDNALRNQQFGEGAARAGYADEQRATALDERYRAADQNNALRALMSDENTRNWQQANAYQDILRGTATEDRNRQIQEMYALRQNPLNELMAFMGGSQVQAPQFASYHAAGAADPANIYGAAADSYKAAMDAANAKNAGRAGITKGLFGLAGSMLGGPIGAAAATKMFS